MFVGEEAYEKLLVIDAIEHAEKREKSYPSLFDHNECRVVSEE